jgi:SpoVK/Ycf46/Vps4 family AAA+-type ATPase
VKEGLRIDDLATVDDSNAAKTQPDLRSAAVVFILATNHIDQFDFAISRLGRFDIVVQVMPPTAAEKLRHWKALREHLENIHTDIGALDKDLSVLAFKEFEVMVPELMSAQTAQEAAHIAEQYAAKCILRQAPIGGDGTWEAKAVEQQRQNRI